MSKVAVQLDSKQIEAIFRQLGPQEKRRLALEVVTEQFLETASKFRSLAKRRKWSNSRVETMVEKAREEFHAKNRR